jgi:hypothetical protein
MTESVDFWFSTFVHPKIWVTSSDIPPTLEPQDHGDHASGSHFGAAC